LFHFAIKLNLILFYINSPVTYGEELPIQKMLSLKSSFFACFNEVSRFLLLYYIKDIRGCW